MRKELEALKKYLAECRPDMHEPDEQGIRAHVIGDHLDNACGESIREHAIANRYQEYVVILVKDGGEPHRINLATLLALARMAKLP